MLNDNNFDNTFLQPMSSSSFESNKIPYAENPIINLDFHVAEPTFHIQPYYSGKTSVPFVSPSYEQSGFKKRTDILMEIRLNQKYIMEFEFAWWMAENYGVSSSGTPIAWLNGPPKYNAIWKYIGNGNWYVGIYRQNEYNASRAKLPLLYQLYSMMPS